MDKSRTIPCERSEATKRRIENYVKALHEAAPSIGDHHLTEEEFWDSGIFLSAVEEIRGKRSASTSAKKDFAEATLNRLKAANLISEFAFTGAGDRHDFQVKLPDGKISIIEAKGCLDGNNTTVYTRPANAEEFIIWSFCQNPGADPRKNVWSGIHTRLGGKIIAEKEQVDALIVWDSLCGTSKRPCPKIASGRGVVQMSGIKTPPPCVYLFPRTIPDPRNNPKPGVWRIGEIGFAHALLKEFGGDERDVTEVHIEARMKGTNVERKTTLKRNGEVLAESKWTNLKRASR